MPTPVEYVAHGWALVPFARGLKGPEGLGYTGWNTRARCVTDVARAATLTEQIGLAHAYSGTCAIDVDDLAGAATWLAAQGITLAKLLDADDAVQISSGRPGRAKLLYKLTTPLPSKKITAPDNHRHTLLEFRCGTHKGTTVQDVLPPSIHPITQRPYEWVTGIAGDWRDLPELPAAVRALWEKLVARPEKSNIPAPTGASADKLRELLKRHNPDAAYDDWVEVGMALHHETSGDDLGLALWDEWSSTGSKYVGIDDLESHWRSFGNHDRPLTIASLRKDLPADAADFDVVSQVAPAGLATANAPAAPSASRERFAFLPWNEFAQRPPLQWHIKGVLPQVEVGVIYGQPGSGKTFLALDLACAIGRNAPWRERKVRGGQVLYVAAEGAQGFAQRLQAIAHQLQLKTLEDLRIKVLADAPNIFDREQALAVARAAVAAGGASVIVIDTLAATSGNANENASEDMKQIVDHCKGLHRATGALVLLVHHSGKDASRGMRGSNVLDGAADVEIEVAQIGEYRVAKLEKLKDGEDGAMFAFKLTPVTLGVDDDGEAITSCIVEHVNNAPSADGKSARRALKGLPKLVYDTARDCLPIEGGKGSVAALITRCVERMPTGGGKDRRAEDVKRALTKSLCGEFIEIEGESYALLG